MFGIFGPSETESEIRSEITKKIDETERAFRVARAIYDHHGLPDGDYHTAYEEFCNFRLMWKGTYGGSKLQLKLIRSSLNKLHKLRMLTASNLAQKYGNPDISN
jgi:hypothetical protein